MRRAIPRHVPICGPPQDVDLSATAHPRTALAHTAALPHKIGKATAAQTRRDRHLEIMFKQQARQTLCDADLCRFRTLPTGS